MSRFTKVLGGLAATSMLLVSGSALAAITGSAHDFRATSGGTTFTGEDEICKACHAPHNNKASSATEVLWNHTKTSTTTYTMYQSNSFEEGVASGDISGSSKLCMSCHDGTVALDSYGTRTPSAGLATGTINFSTDLSNDHPISFTYDEAGEDLKPAATTNVTFAGTTPSGATIANAMLDGGKVECKSCHDVHNQKSQTADLLLISNTNSALCLTCHTK